MANLCHDLAQFFCIFAKKFGNMGYDFQQNLIGKYVWLIETILRVKRISSQRDEREN